MVFDVPEEMELEEPGLDELELDEEELEELGRLLEPAAPVGTPLSCGPCRC